jgi:hypothetical protein
VPVTVEPEVPKSLPADGTDSSPACFVAGFAATGIAGFATDAESSADTAVLRVARFAIAGAASLADDVVSAEPSPVPTDDFEVLFAVDFVVPAAEDFAADDDLVELAAEDSLETCSLENCSLETCSLETCSLESCSEEPDSTSVASATAVAVAAAPPAFANHSRIVSARPIDTGERWVAISGISSAWQRATMSLELTPSSLAS